MDAIDDYSWDDSIEQYTLLQDIHQTVPPRNTIACNNSSDSLTSSLTEASHSDDEVFHNPDPPSRSNRFRRVNVLRKRRVRRTLSFTNPLSSDTDYSSKDLQPPVKTSLYQPNRSNMENHPEETQTQHPIQNAQQYENPRPLLPQDVQLGPRVQDLSRPLQTIRNFPNLQRPPLSIQPTPPEDSCKSIKEPNIQPPDERARRTDHHACPRPRLPADVHLNHQVQDLTQPLETIRTAIYTNRQARSTRSHLDYKIFHKDGTKRRRQ